ncbi:MAG: transcription termination factor Rho [Lachnospiraceae bacterium]|nr:transcription termination factor Rho [Lachnospiraceae bacterium]
MDYSKMQLSALKERAKELGLKGVSTLKKQELADLLAQVDAKLAENRKNAEAKKAEDTSADAKSAGEKPAENGTSVSTPENAPRRGRKPLKHASETASEGVSASAAEKEENAGADESAATAENNAAGNSAAAENNVAENSASAENAGAPERNNVPPTGEVREGVLELVPNEEYGFVRSGNYLSGDKDVYVSPSQINRLRLKTGDYVRGILRARTGNERNQGFAFIESVNGIDPLKIRYRKRFEDLTPIFPHERIHLETENSSPSMRLVDLISPVGKGQRGMIVSQPKAGKTTLLKQVANAIKTNHPEIHIIILLIDERPEEVTDMRESIEGDDVEVIYSTFDELPDNHKKVSEMVLERSKRLVESGKDVVILLDSITRLARAYNLTVSNSGKTLSGGLDPAALYMPKKFFGAARCMREGGSLTVLATALVETGSRMDDVVFEEFKGTGNMELVLDRSLSERRIFPAISLPKSGTRRDDLLLSKEEFEAAYLMRRALNGVRSDDAIEVILNYVKNTKNNAELVHYIKTHGIFPKA